MAELRRQIAVLARSPLPVLIEGETGTGKSFLAEHVLHPRSGAKGPLVVTDLSTIPESLMPAHLFGSRRGSYTGAVEDHAGVFEQAHTGTLFLDEIANLDLESQRRLLLVLERGTVTRLGDSRPRSAAPKLVAATNADLPDLIRFALLDALRSEQLRPLVRAYLARFPTPDDYAEEANSVHFGKPQGRAQRRDAFSIFLPQGALHRLCAHPWPGNHRELKLLATNALVFSLVQHLDADVPPLPAAEKEEAPSARAPAVLAIPDALVDRLLGKPAAQRPSSAPGPVLSGSTGDRRVEIALKPGGSFAEISAEVERQYLMALFHAHGGDLDRMAAELFGPGASRRKVHLRMNQLGLRLRNLRGATP